MNEADCLLNKVNTFWFILQLIIFDRLLTYTKSLSETLQKVNVDLSKASDLVIATQETLKLFHSDSEWEKIFEHAKNVANVNGIEIAFPKPTRQKRVPLYLEGYITNTLSCSRDPLSNSKQFKDYLYFPILDCFIEELDKRFNAKNLNLMRAIHALQPDSAEFLNAKLLKCLSVCYYLDHESLTLETNLARRALVNYEMDSIRDVLIELTPLR